MAEAQRTTDSTTQNAKTAEQTAQQKAHKEPLKIKKYSNRRLYHTGTSSYVTLQDLAKMVKAGEEFIVTDAKSGEDITRSILAQIIFDEENNGEMLLPQNFLKQLIRYYDDNLKAMVPGYLDYALTAFDKDQERYREVMSRALDASNSFGSMFEQQARANMALFEKTLGMFSGLTPMTEKPTDAKDNSELKALKEEIAALHKAIHALSEKT